MITLGIETSCDETSCSVLKDTDTILSNIISSSLFRHQDFGGVVPEIASRHSLEQIEFVYQSALEKAGIIADDIDLIAVTEGPGLIGSLFVGVSFAKALSYALGKPLIGVNHLEAHLYANFIENQIPDQYIGLLVSGGHTLLSYHDQGNIELIGETVDDAIGEAYDKVAKVLNLGYPGGPILDQIAQKTEDTSISFTKPKQKDPYAFSFSGVKTAVLYMTQDPKTGIPKKDAPKPENLVAGFQRSVISWVVEKTIQAAREKEAKYIVVGGGVSANSLLREKMMAAAEKEGIEVYIPPLALTGDNGVMIARKGVELYEKGMKNDLHLAARPNLHLIH